MQQIDMKSEEFKNELQKTWEFIEKVNKQFNFVQNPNQDVNEGVAMGLARNRLIYGKRYCPCFMVEGETKEERKKANNRICPCKPALEEEIPQNGLCHCGLFCTPEYAKSQTLDKDKKDTKKDSNSLSKDQADKLVQKEQIDGEELKALLKARDDKLVDFILVDTRELMEYQMAHIEGTDLLLPTSLFHVKVEELLGDKKDQNIIVYCQTGSRSFQVQRVLKTIGFNHVGNLKPGIVSYSGNIKESVA